MDGDGRGFWGWGAFGVVVALSLHGDWSRNGPRVAVPEAIRIHDSE